MVDDIVPSYPRHLRYFWWGFWITSVALGLALLPTVFLPVQVAQAAIHSAKLTAWSGVGMDRPLRGEIRTGSDEVISPENSLALPGQPHKVVIIPGHGGKDFGAVHRGALGAEDVVEKDVNLAIARKLAARLWAGGYGAMLTRDGDYSATPNPFDTEAEIQAVLDIANSSQADILVSIHGNGYPDPSFSGTETYYCPERSFAPTSRRLAEAIQKHMLSALRDVMGYANVDRGVKSAKYKPYGCLYTLGGDRGGTFRPSAMPGVLVETLFVSNDYEAWILSQDGGQDLIASAIYDGIGEYFDAPQAP